MAMRRNIWGVGPSVGWIAGVAFVIALLVDRVLAPKCQIVWMSQQTAWTIGSALLLVGIPSYLLVWRLVRRAFADERLITTGIFRWVRHPLYSIGTLFLCLGVCVLFRSYVLLGVPAVMWAAIHVRVPVEEAALIQRFGDAYRAYQQQVGMLLPGLGRKPPGGADTTDESA